MERFDAQTEQAYQDWLAHISNFSEMILGAGAPDHPVARGFFRAGIPAGLAAQLYVCSALDAAAERAEAERN